VLELIFVEYFLLVTINLVISADFLYHTQDHITSFLRKRMVGGRRPLPFYLKFWANRPPLERNRRFWPDNRSRSFNAIDVGSNWKPVYDFL